MLSLPWNNHKPQYDVVVIGSGYGGAITAARIANANLNPKRSVCILERGREWPVGRFPDKLDEALRERRDSNNPLGLYELIDYSDISVVKGSGLGGTSLVNANVAIVPDAEVFDQEAWPAGVTLDVLRPYYEKAQQTLRVKPHPRAHNLLKVQALARRGSQVGVTAEALNIAVNFDIDGENEWGAQQSPCIDCGDCISGCNVGAKNTLYMNYLPMAARAGAEIFTQCEVLWVEKLSGGGWRIHGRRYKGPHEKDGFSIDAGNVILSAGAINTPEILLRSEQKGLSVSPALGTRFSGNGDFFGIAYNGDHRTNVLGFGSNLAAPGAAMPPGPSIVGILRYSPAGDLDQRFTIEDLSFPNAYVDAAKAAFSVLRGEDTDTGDEDEERRRILRDLVPFAPAHADGAMNHTMLYLCMGFDDARGSMTLDTHWWDRNGRLKIEWDDAGRQRVFRKVNEELRRHARAEGASFVANPLWTIFDSRHLYTAHPLGGCPMGDDYGVSAVDEYGRLFAGDGSVHDGLYVADGSLIPTALGVNPFLTISALSERIADRKIKQLGGDEYPAPPHGLGSRKLDSRDVLTWNEGELEQLFRRTPSLDISLLVNSGERSVDPATQTIRNDAYWKGFFPKGHVLQAMSAALFTGFQKRFFRQDGDYAGVTSDTDGRINARNSLEALHLTRKTGDLEPGDYVLLRYVDPPWQGYYDIFKIVNENLLIGRVYLGPYPNGLRVFTFPMVREYGFGQMTVDDHRRLWAAGGVPTKEQLDGVWRMDTISNANQAGAVAFLEFRHQPDGRLESRYQLMGLIEGLVMPRFGSNHFQLNDFTGFHDEIRRIDDSLMVGKYVMKLPAGAAPLFPAASLGLLHVEESDDGSRYFGVYYLLTRTEDMRLPTNRLLSPLLDTHLPDGVGLEFDETMEGWLHESGRPAWEGRSEDAVDLSFTVKMIVADLNEFIEGAAHEARLKGAIRFSRFLGEGPAILPIDERKSLFHYLRVNDPTREAEMRYHIEFTDVDNRRFILEGRKFMQKDESGGIRAIQEILEDYTTLFCHFYEETGNGLEKRATAVMKFRTFEDLPAIRNLAGFLRSFKVTNTDDPLLQLQAQIRFLAFTGHFVMQEYDPLGAGAGLLPEDVRSAVLHGAATPDFFSTRPTAELQAILRDVQGLPIDKLLNTGEVRIDFDRKRIFRDSFWKGSFAKDNLMGWEERIRNGGLGVDAEKAAAAYAGGSFWKRFDKLTDGVLDGYVVNYELHNLPGLPKVREVAYPDDERRYLRKDDKVLQLTYTNQPYRIVYDLIKVIDNDSAVGVMHLGNFPDGMEFATFVMERHNYPFENMSVEDHRTVFADPRCTPPTADSLAGDWEGQLVFLTRPNISLSNQANPVVFRLSFRTAGAQVEGRFRFALLRAGVDISFTDEFVTLTDMASIQTLVRAVDRNTLIGKWLSPPLPPALLSALEDYVEPARSQFAVYFVLTRKP